MRCANLYERVEASTTQVTAGDEFADTRLAQVGRPASGEKPRRATDEFDNA
jgi:hypothetical protein